MKKNKTPFTTVNGKPVNETELLHKIKSQIEQAEKKAKQARAQTDLAWDTQVQRATIDMFIDALNHGSIYYGETLGELSKKGNILAIIEHWGQLYKYVQILETTYSDIISLINKGELGAKE
jgi:uncharacterized protein YycO